MDTAYDPLTDEPTPVLLVDAQHLLRIGVAALIDAEPDLWVAAQASKAGDILDLCERYRPELVLADLDVLDPEPGKRIEAVRALAYGPRVIVLTHRCTEEDVYQAMRAGASAYILKSSPPDELLRCLRSVREGGTFVPPPVASKLAARLNTSGLSPRELQVLARLASGQSNKRIGLAFGISDGTVKSHNKRIFYKLGVNNRISAVAAAVQRGLIAL
jgi:two-component system NarL family response regulator